MRLPKLLICIVLCANALAGQTPLPLVPGAKVVDLSPRGGRYTEPSIAINPNNPKQIVAVWQGGTAVQGRGGAAYSTDAGRIFTTATGTQSAHWRVMGDVTTTFDNKGHAFLCYLAFDQLGTASYWAHNASRNGIFVLRSRDGGKTWDKEAIAVKAFPTGHESNLQFEDEPRIFADNNPNSPFAGSLYTGWVEWQIDKSVMLFSRSTDAGKSWSPASQVSTHPGLPRDDNGSLGGFVEAVAPDGAIYAIWHDGNRITFTESHDGGKSFSHPRPVIETGPPYFSEVPGVSRVEGFAQIGIDASSGKKGGNIYITWSDYRNGDVDVFLSSSSDYGRNWSAPTRVNNDPIHNGKDQFYQWMAVDPTAGAVYVLFYDRRDDPKNRNMRMTLARSTNSGRTFMNYTWTDTAFEGRHAFLGDYTWVAAYGNRVYGVWTEAEPQSRQAKPGRSAESRGSGEPTTVIRVGLADFTGK
jgi:hypothetical protein